MLERLALSGEEEEEEENFGLPVWQCVAMVVYVGGEAEEEEEEHEDAPVFCCGTVVFGAEDE